MREIQSRAVVPEIASKASQRANVVAKRNAARSLGGEALAAGNSRNGTLRRETSAVSAQRRIF